jgi:2-oxoacid:acceptor oxidoreductase gamma subunit (pyruvate/2-ketoisovalerate family)/2-oxoacid:acceptor oxidoreductase delta subunit (pyruvate/2-ketoisovalerate family)
MEQIKEIRFHGRGGQGIVLASEMVVHAAMFDGLYATALPSFGVERRGSPVAAFVRINDRPIREKTQIYSPNCIVIADATLLGGSEVFDGIREGTVMVLNSNKEVETLGLPGAITKLAILDATDIGIETLGIPVTNTALVGAFAKATGWVRLPSMFEGIRAVMGEELAEKNIEAARWAAQKVRIFEIAGRTAGGGQPRPDKRPRIGGRLRPGQVMPCGRELIITETGEWRSERPILDNGRCHFCGQCRLICPCFCIHEQESAFRIDLKFCKGCGLCASQCEFGAIHMEREQK